MNNEEEFDFKTTNARMFSDRPYSKKLEKEEYMNDTQKRMLSYIDELSNKNKKLYERSKYEGYPNRELSYALWALLTSSLVEVFIFDGKALALRLTNCEEFFEDEPTEKEDE